MTLEEIVCDWITQRQKLFRVVNLDTMTNTEFLNVLSMALETRLGIERAKTKETK